MAGVVLLALTACAEEKATPVEQEVRWVGAEPTSPLEQDSWVKAVRVEQVAEAVARNRNDFSLPEFSQAATRTYIDREASTALDALTNHGTTTLLPGPWPFAPTEVEVGYAGKGDDVAAVRGCVAGNWSMDAGQSLGSLSSFGREFRLERGDDGVIRVDSTLLLPDMDCTVVGALPVALFDPVPQPSGVTEPEDLVRPGETEPPRRR